MIAIYPVTVRVGRIGRFERSEAEGAAGHDV